MCQRSASAIIRADASRPRSSGTDPRGPACRLRRDAAGGSWGEARLERRLPWRVAGSSSSPRSRTRSATAGAELVCPGGLGGNAVLASATIADGSTLIAFSNIYPGKRSVALRSVTSTCASNPEFGDDGAATIAIPSSLRPTDPAGEGFPTAGMWVNAIAPRNGGGAIVAGVYGGSWVVGEVTAQGTVDQTFGSDGWALLPLPGQVTAVLQEASGRIVIAGDNGGGWLLHGELGGGPVGAGPARSWDSGNRAGRCCRRARIRGPLAGARAERRHPGSGRLRKHGLLGPRARHAHAVRSARAGVRTAASAVLATHTASVPSSATRTSTGKASPSSVQDRKPCDDEPPGSTAPATGLMASFRTDGTPARHAARFRSRMYGSVQALARRPRRASSPRRSTPTRPTITLTALYPDGSTDPRFASHGSARIRTPWRGTQRNILDGRSRSTRRLRARSSSSRQNPHGARCSSSACACDRRPLQRGRYSGGTWLLTCDPWYRWS